MSREQAGGRSVYRRAVIWALGVVLAGALSLTGHAGSPRRAPVVHRPLRSPRSRDRRIGLHRYRARPQRT